MSLTRQQLDVVRRARQQANRRGATALEKLALTASMGVESQYTELTGGDRDSTGALQQRPSQGWGPIGESLEKDVDQFLAHAKQYRGKGLTADQLAQSVQRSAFPERYGQRLGEAKAALAAVRGLPSAAGGRPRAPRLNPGSTTNDQRGAMLAALMDHRKGMSLLDRYHGQIQSGNFTTTTPPTVQSGIAPRAGTLKSGDSNSRLAKVTAKANRIDAQKRPYLYGGGHGGSTDGPLDCSAAVSKVLGIDVRVSGQFTKWGKPGRGRDITVYANAGHVLVEIGGQFWGTSAANPGGGAGWIPRSKISASYLASFTARHPG